MRIQNYFTELKYRFDTIRKHSYENDLLLSNRFSVFDYICVDENKLSDILVDLLNPIGKHGQRDLFLNLFIKMIGKKDLITNYQPKVYREVGTKFIERTQRRMDILIKWEDFGIMIENKPWAKDQFEQILDYKLNLTKKFKDNFLIIYLSNNKIEPDVSSISKEELSNLKKKNQYIQLSIQSELKFWVEQSFKECQSDKIRWFLKDFIIYIENNFNN